MPIRAGGWGGVQDHPAGKLGWRGDHGHVHESGGAEKSSAKDYWSGIKVTEKQYSSIRFVGGGRKEPGSIIHGPTCKYRRILTWKFNVHIARWQVNPYRGHLWDLSSTFRNIQQYGSWEHGKKKKNQSRCQLYPFRPWLSMWNCQKTAKNTAIKKLLKEKNIWFQRRKISRMQCRNFESFWAGNQQKATA